MESNGDDTEVLLATPSSSSRKRVEGQQLQVQDGPVCFRSSRFCCGTTLVEPVILLVFFSLMAIGSIKTQFIYHSVAKDLDPNNTAIDRHSIASLCNVSNMSDINQDAVQKRTAFYSLAFQLMYGIPNMIGSFIVGSISDSIGRRVGLCLPILGQGLSYAAVAFVITLDLPLWSFFITEFVSGISGSVFPVAAAYLADATPEESRTFRMSVLDVGLFLTIGVGLFAYNEWLQLAKGIQTVMFIPIVTFMVAAFIYVVVFLKETVVEGAAQSRRHRPTAWESIKKCKEVFRIEEENSCSSSSSSSPRRKVNVAFLLLFACFVFAQMAYPSQSLESLYLMNHPLCWEPRQLGIFAMLGLFVYSLATLFSTKCLVRLPRIGGDVFLLLLSLTSGIMAYVVMAFLRSSWMAWLYVGVGCFKIVCLPVLRSMMSKTVSPSAFGSLYACVSVIESGINLVVGSVFSFIYAQTLGWFPGFIFLIISGAFAIAIGIVIAFKCLGYDQKATKGGEGGGGGGGGGEADECVGDGGRMENGGVQSRGYRVVDASAIET